MEFAFVAPLLLLLAFSLLSLGYGIWTRNALQAAASETARCVAVGSSACGSTQVGCTSSDMGACFFRKVAAKRGVSGVLESQVTINQDATYAGISFISVAVAYPLTIGGYTFLLRATGQFPN